MCWRRAGISPVALPTEGVDRNVSCSAQRPGDGVALPTEGVDRNQNVGYISEDGVVSPSPRRAWIEINFLALQCMVPLVALPTEGVDRNSPAPAT